MGAADFFAVVVVVFLAVVVEVLPLFPSTFTCAAAGIAMAIAIRNANNLIVFIVVLFLDDYFTWIMRYLDDDQKSCGLVMTSLRFSLSIFSMLYDLRGWSVNSLGERVGMSNSVNW